LFIDGDLARKNIAECGEGIMESLEDRMNGWSQILSGVIDLVVNPFIKVLDEDVSLTRLAKSRVALRPHDAAVI
jgi:hypothetical protein